MSARAPLPPPCQGKTVLYIPAEEIGDFAVAAKEKDLVHRLESTLIHWTRQIKEVVNTQDNAELGEDSGPLAEIEFWRSRSVDLSGIRAQLDHPGVAAIVTVLEQAKSSYLPPFLNLSNLIQREAVAAEDNLKVPPGHCPPPAMFAERPRFLAGELDPLSSFAQLETYQPPVVSPTTF